MPRKKKETPPVDPNTLDRDTIMFYRGRHPAFKAAHFYVLKDTNKEVTFRKKLQRYHKIGMGYPVVITQNGRSFGTTTKLDWETVEIWPDKKEIAQWIRNDEAYAREEKRLSEAAGLRASARGLALKIKEQYKRASHEGKRDIIASFIEELES